MRAIEEEVHFTDVSGVEGFKNFRVCSSLLVS